MAATFGIWWNIFNGSHRTTFVDKVYTVEKKTALIWQFGKTAPLLSTAGVFATAGYFEDICLGNMNESIFRSSFVATTLFFALFYSLANPEEWYISLAFAEIEINLKNITFLKLQATYKKAGKVLTLFKSSQELLNSMGKSREGVLLRASNDKEKDPSCSNRITKNKIHTIKSSICY